MEQLPTDAAKVNSHLTIMRNDCQLFTVDLIKAYQANNNLSAEIREAATIRLKELESK